MTEPSEERLPKPKVVEILLSMGLDNEELAKALKNIKEYTIAGIDNYFTEIEKEKQQQIDKAKEEQIKKQIANKKNAALELQQKEEQVERIKEKIQAAQQEIRSKEAPIDLMLTTDDKVWDGFYVIRVFVDNSSILVGLDKNATSEDLYRKVEEKLKAKRVTLFFNVSKTKVARDKAPLLAATKFRRVALKAVLQG